MSGRFLQQRSASIRSRVLLLLLAPLLPLIGIWVFSTTQTVSTATNLLDGQTMADHIGLPTSEVVFQLQRERKLSTRLAGGDTGVAGDLKAQRMQTDVAVAALRGEAGSTAVVDTAGDQALAGIQTLVKTLETLPVERAAVDTKRKSRLDILSSYDDMIDKAFTVYYSISEVIDNHEIANQASLSVSLTEAREMYSREDAILAGALAGGSFAAGERSLLVQSIGTQRHLYDAAARRLSPEDALRYAEIQKGDAYLRVRSAEDKLVEMTRNQVTGIDPAIWNADYTLLNQQLGDLESAVTRRTIAAAGPAGTAVLVRLGVAGGIGLILIAVLLFVSIRASRSILRRIASLRQHALSVADHGLPAIIAKLRAGESVDIEATAPPLPPADDELGQLDGAFALMQRTAVLAAVQEAQLRTGLNQVFLNLGRRTQTLVHRQLALLDAMERRITDPRDLEDLYRIDHLGARMRRHAEDLVILAGAVPGRGWRNPVPLHDVLRSSVSEVEEYTRITLIPLPEMALAGRAVSDVVHLIAELLENATAFSPRETHVRLSGQLVPNGFAVEIEDRGVGMPADDILRANSRLAEPPDFDPAHSSRLGLFVVARLAARHNIRVTLKDSPYGGITAVALLPREIIVETVDGIEEPPQLAAAPHAAVAAPPAPLTGSVVPPPVGSLVTSPWNGSPPPAAPPAQDVPNLATLGAGGLLAGGVEPGLAGNSTAGLVKIASTASPAPAEPPVTDAAPEAQVVDSVVEIPLMPTLDLPAVVPSRLPDWAARLDATPPNGLHLPANAPTGLQPAAPAGGVRPVDRQPLDRQPVASEPVAVAEPVPARTAAVLTENTAPNPLVSANAGPRHATSQTFTPEGLPLRQRQASLAPQLREVPPTPAPSRDAPRTAAPDVADRPRPPEQRRSMLSSLQAGTNRGRLDATTVAEPGGETPADLDDPPAKEQTP